MRMVSTILNAFGAYWLTSKVSRTTQRTPSPACGGGLGWGLFDQHSWQLLAEMCASDRVKPEGGIRFADKDMRQKRNLWRFRFI